MKTTWIVLAVAAGAVAPAWAIRVGNEATPVDTGKVLQTASPVAAGAAASHADDSTSMRQGMINSVNASRDQIEVNGSWLKIAAGKTRLFQRGQVVGSDALSKGQLLKFTLLPGATDRFTLGVVYVP